MIFRCNGFLKKNRNKGKRATKNKVIDIFNKDRIKSCTNTACLALLTLTMSLSLPGFDCTSDANLLSGTEEAAVTRADTNSHTFWSHGLVEEIL